ncbi:hypothetical protein [Parendozoicomonas sp. Alg238-R29]|uniref:hypothetical protein n=1 Tax=Parendozoicomonas sp. Alg238-R29 TaxID=2993446 RepID=UPI00248F1CAD|nr:hypothetical protein [Parendozoicomonas sp. Alg238-R29]
MEFKVSLVVNISVIVLLASILVQNVRQTTIFKVTQEQLLQMVDELKKSKESHAEKLAEHAVKHNSHDLRINHLEKRVDGIEKERPTC